MNDEVSAVEKLVHDYLERSYEAAMKSEAATDEAIRNEWHMIAGRGAP